MKTKQEIEQLAQQYIEDNTGDHYVYCGFVDGYTQCQEDIGKELEALRAAIRKNTWYDIDGNAFVNLDAIDNNILNKQD